jgi:hypothetical protein
MKTAACTALELVHAIQKSNTDVSMNWGKNRLSPEESWKPLIYSPKEQKQLASSKHTTASLFWGYKSHTSILTPTVQSISVVTHPSASIASVS